MELLEICEQDGTPTGRYAERSVIHAKGLPHRTVHVWVVNRSGGILFQKRASGKDSHPGFWDVSAAGHVQPGESPLDTARRELEEELGLSASAGGLRHAGVRTVLLRSRGVSSVDFVDNEITDVFVTRFDGSIGELDIDREEVEAVRFIHAGELARLLRDERFEREFVPHGREYYLWVTRLVP